MTFTLEERVNLLERKFDCLEAALEEMCKGGRMCLAAIPFAGVPP